MSDFYDVRASFISNGGLPMRVVITRAKPPAVRVFAEVELGNIHISLTSNQLAELRQLIESCIAEHEKGNAEVSVALNETHWQFKSAVEQSQLKEQEVKEPEPEVQDCEE